MIKKIKAELTSLQNRALISNFISLSALQVIGFVLPFVILPYLIQIIGVEKFGLVSFAQALMSYFMVFTDYGFNLSATRRISIHRKNNKKLNMLFNSTLTTKFLLGILSYFILIMLLKTIPKLGAESNLYQYSFLLVFGQLLFPIWFFQGIEEMKFITYLIVFSKLIFTGLMYVFIKEPGDYILVNLFQGLGNIIASIISIVFIIKKFNIVLKLPSIRRIGYELQDGMYIFISNSAISIYMNSSIIILGIFVSPVVLGYYSIAEKIMIGVRQILSVFSQVIYPHVCKLAVTSHSELLKFYKKVFIPFAFFIVTICLILFLSADFLVLFLTKNNIKEIAVLIRILSFVPLIVCFNIPAYQTLLAYNLKKSYSMILGIGSVFCIVLNIIFAQLFGAKGTCFSIISAELLILVGLYWVLEKKHKECGLFTSKIN
jgi:PST family polysaccharide transporter